MSNQKSILRKLEKERTAILNALLEISPIIPGAYKEVYRRCGKPNCWCSKGKGHPLKRVSWTESGISYSKAVAENEIEWAIIATSNYRLFRKLHSQFEEIQNQIERLLKKIEWETIQKSRKEKHWK